MPVYQAVMGFAPRGGVGVLSDRSVMRWIFLSANAVLDRSLSGRSLAGVRVLNSGLTELDVSPSLAHPAVHCLDGHAQTYCEVDARSYYVELTLDTGLSGRKEFLSLRYPYGREIEPTLVEFANDASGPWATPTGSLTAVSRGMTGAVWLLPWRGSVTEFGSFSAVSAVEGLRLEFVSAAWTGNELAGWTAYQTTGPNVGVERQIVASASSPNYWYLTKPFPHNPVGYTTSARRISENYLGGRYVRVRLRLRGSAGRDVFQLSGLGLHEFLFECVGDLSLQFGTWPTNPSAVSGEHDTGLVRRRLLSGGRHVQSVSSPADRMNVSWGVMHSDQVELLKDLGQRAEICIVDHHGHLRSGYIEGSGGIGWDDLERAVGRGEERAVRMTFQEV
ncbi:hypothetical protein KJZ99_00130 [bacterium]|nr:hypothetical protein [bacterium]